MTMGHSYCSDKYQYTMGKTFRDTGLDKVPAIFNMFYRKAPDNNNWAVVSGVNEVLEMVRGFGSQPASFLRNSCRNLSMIRFVTFWLPCVLQVISMPWTKVRLPSRVNP